MTRRPTPSRCVLFACPALFAAHAPAQEFTPGEPQGPRFVLIDRFNVQSDAPIQPTASMTAPQVVFRRIQSASGAASRLVFIDSLGVERSRSLGDILTIAPAAWATIPGTSPATSPLTESAEASDDAAVAAAIELVDGQRLRGWPAALAGGLLRTDAPEKADFIAWQHARLGLVSISFENTARIVIDWPGEPAQPAVVAGAPTSSDDLILLRNGDRLRGLVESIGRTVVITASAEKGAAPARTEVTIDRIREIVLSNPRRPASGTRAWLRDGSVIGVANLESSPPSAAEVLELGGDASPLLGAPSARVAWPAVETVSIAPDAGAFRPLSELPIAVPRAPGSRRQTGSATVAPAPANALAAPWPLGARDVELRGPVTAEWTLPSGAVRLIGAMEMPEGAWAWGDCLVTFSLLSPGNRDGAEISRTRLNAEHPWESVSLRLPDQASGEPRTLRIAIEAGANGPIQDWVNLRRLIVELDAK